MYVTPGNLSLTKVITQMPYAVLYYTIAIGTTNNKMTEVLPADWFAHVGLRFPNPKRFTKISKQFIDENEEKFFMKRIMDPVNLPKYNPGFILSTTP